RLDGPEEVASRVRCSDAEDHEPEDQDGGRDEDGGGDVDPEDAAARHPRWRPGRRVIGLFRTAHERSSVRSGTRTMGQCAPASTRRVSEVAPGQELRRPRGRPTTTITASV